MIELGGNIELIGFSELDSQELLILKKIIGSQARKFSDNVKGYEKLTIDLKQTKGKKKFEVQAKLMANSKPINSEVTEKNLFIAIAEVLKKLEAQSK